MVASLSGAAAIPSVYPRLRTERWNRQERLYLKYVPRKFKGGIGDLRMRIQAVNYSPGVYDAGKA
jgi:hypothetical protein